MKKNRITTALRYTYARLKESQFVLLLFLLMGMILYFVNQPGYLNGVLGGIVLYGFIVFGYKLISVC